MIRVLAIIGTAVLVMCFGIFPIALAYESASTKDDGLMTGAFVMQAFFVFVCIAIFSAWIVED